ncbi:MAG: methylmalonyl Co-A mutase-associated GTPase MeaB [Casimicrobiaceae bacterium]
MGTVPPPAALAPPLTERAVAMLAAVAAGNRGAIARAITALENGSPFAPELAAEVGRIVAERAGRAHVVGITGAPGAGKSTLINALLGELLSRGERVAVVAIDPSSPRTGGAVLGDRIRMGEFGADERVFIRSLAARGHLGGLSRTTGAVIDLLDAAGYATVIVETVGAGQSEVDIAAIADTSIVVCPPGLGDDVQAIKAGILEIADLFVVSKGDLPAAGRTVRDLKEMLGLRPRPEGWRVPVLSTTATTREGIPALVDAIRDHAATAGKARRLRKPFVATDPASALPALHVARLAGRDAFLRHSGIAFVAGGPGTATLRMRVAAAHINFNGTCHGGALFTLADSAFGLACNSYGVLAAAIDGHVTFHTPVREGDALRACAVEISRSKRVCVYRVEVTREQDAALVCAFTGTAYITGRPNFDSAADLAG